MSCDWDVYCRDCDSRMGFDDANHAVEMMRALCRLAPGFADLSFNEDVIDLQIGCYGRVAPVAWLVAHATHRLVPRDEYGTFDTQCREWVTCAGCDARHRCKLDHGHAPPCSAKAVSLDRKAGP